MAGVITPTPANPSLAVQAGRFLGAQFADQTLLRRLWAPVAFGGGCAVYFALKAEPPAWPLLAGAVLTAGAWFAARRLGAGRLWTLPLTPDLWIGDSGTNAAWVEAGQAVAMRSGVRQFAVDVWSRCRGLTPTERAVEAWTCSRFGCAPAAAEAGPLAMWWGRRAPSMEQVDVRGQRVGDCGRPAGVVRGPAGAGRDGLRGRPRGRAVARRAGVSQSLARGLGGGRARRPAVESVRRSRRQ